MSEKREAQFDSLCQKEQLFPVTKVASFKNYCIRSIEPFKIND